MSVQSKAEVETFGQEQTLPNGSTFNHRKTIEKIGYHKLGKFYECADEDAVFYSLGQKRAPHFSKKLDADTKDYTLEAEGGNTHKSFVANIRWQRWEDDSNFAIDLNDLSEGCGEYGSFVLKRTPKGEVKNDLRPCNLLYLWFDPTVEWIEESPIIELHQLTEYQVRKMKGWRNIDAALKKAELVELSKEKTPGSLVIQKYKFWERTGEFIRYDENNKPIDKDPVYYHAIFCGYGDDEVIVFDEVTTPEDCPYYDFHISKYEDRWLRVGVYERLFELQRLVNELVNYNRQANAVASLLILLSRDKSLIGRNVIQEAFSGMILDANSLQQAGIDNRFLSGFLAELMRYEIKADELCMTPEVITGEKLPSGATFRGQAVLTNIANDAFDNPRDRIHTRLAKKIMKDVLPALLEEWNADDVLEIAANEKVAKKFDEYFIDIKVNEYIAGRWAQNENPTLQELEDFKQGVIKDWNANGRRIKNMKEFFKGTFSLKFNPTGESANKEQRNDVYYNALALIKEYPSAFMELLQQYLEYNGISPVRITLEDITAKMQGMMQGAGQGTQIPEKQPDKLMSMVNQ